MKIQHECDECGCGAPEYLPGPGCKTCAAWKAGAKAMQRACADEAMTMAHGAEGAVLRCERDQVDQPTVEFYRGRSEAFRKVENALRAIEVGP